MRGLVTWVRNPHVPERRNALCKGLGLWLFMPVTFLVLRRLEPGPRCEQGHESPPRSAVRGDGRQTGVPFGCTPEGALFDVCELKNVRALSPCSTNAAPIGLRACTPRNLRRARRSRRRRGETAS